MARANKEPKPYTLKTRRGERPFQYSAEYYASRGALDGASRTAWMRRFSPDQELRRSVRI